MISLLTDARHFIADALHAAKLGQETHALVSAESALNRLRSLLDRNKHTLPPQVLSNARRDLFTSNGN